MGRTLRRRPGAIELGRRVRERRNDLGLSQMAFAFVVGLHPTYVSDVEQGRRNVSLETLLRIASALDLDPGELVRGLKPARP